MSKRFSFLAAPVLALVMSGAPSVAEEPATIDTVLATVNGTEITLGHMVSVLDGAPSYRQLPDDVLFDGLLDQLIDQTLLQQSLNGAESRSVQLSVENQRRALMSQEAVQDILKDSLTEAAIEQAYKVKYADAEPSREYLASHILVDTEDEAISLKSDLDGGADFAVV